MNIGPGDDPGLFISDVEKSMLVKKLLHHFDQRTTLRVDVNEVHEQLLNLGVEDTIKFHFTSMDAGMIRGMLDRWEGLAPPYGDPAVHSDIIIASDMGKEDDYWKRLVAVKELLHVADCSELSAESEAAVNVLFANFALPPELRAANGTQTRSYANDQMRFYLAMAVLVPKKCRENLRPLYPHTLNDANIAEIAEIPERYIPVIMGTHFESAIEAYLMWEEGVENGIDI